MQDESKLLFAKVFGNKSNVTAIFKVIQNFLDNFEIIEIK